MQIRYFKCKKCLGSEFQRCKCFSSRSVKIVGGVIVPATGSPTPSINTMSYYNAANATASRVVEIHLTDDTATNPYREGDWIKVILTGDLAANAILAINAGDGTGGTAQQRQLTDDSIIIMEGGMIGPEVLRVGTGGASTKDNRSNLFRGHAQGGLAAGSIIYAYIVQDSVASPTTALKDVRVIIHCKRAGSGTAVRNNNVTGNNAYGFTHTNSVTPSNFPSDAVNGNINNVAQVY